ncbi:MAG: hypothetical protein KDD32_11425 [Bacteroidetes bacterium]|nr:hypothetical protein [Bacteroidota bacterium]
MRSLLIFLFYLGALSLLAQQNQTVKDRMNYFSFLEGEWEGIGYYTRQNGWVDTVYQHELAEYKLNRTILTIEGTGKNKSGELVFNAFATLYFDNQIKIYEMMAFKDDGAMTLAHIDTVSAGHFIWSFSSNSYAHIKYELELSEEGAWTEKGFFSSDKENWIPFFSMKLNKIEK